MYEKKLQTYIHLNISSEYEEKCWQFLVKTWQFYVFSNEQHLRFLYMTLTYANKCFKLWFPIHTDRHAKYRYIYW